MYEHIGTIPQTNKESSLGLKKTLHLQIKQKKVLENPCNQSYMYANNDYNNMTQSNNFKSK